MYTMIKEGPESKGQQAKNEPLSLKSTLNTVDLVKI